MSSQITYLPDQSNINRVRDALSITPPRASLMVGAGFSKNAEKKRFDVDDIPLWDDLAEKLFDRLYPERATRARAGTAGNISADTALRLAEEYKSAFGSSQLYNHLEQLIRNSDFIPGETHTRLLRLPWRDVFTTNWDSLLEDAASNVGERPYGLVETMKQLPLVGQPRIIKLHGSLPSHFPLIFSEEDYRTYPRKFAPFVNTVQQAMMETVFLLIGFSGNDPNFIKWSGWVRDNLGEAAPMIYLAGWLDLSRHERRMLESRNVMPIDLAEHPNADCWYDSGRHHENATKWLLHSLEVSDSYDRTTWPLPPPANETPIPPELEPIEKSIASVPIEEPEAPRG